jgi:hypothetical protein
MRPVPTPRSLLLVVWGNAWLAGRCSLEAAVRAVTGADEPHAVDDAPLPDDELDLEALLRGLETLGVRGLRLALPVPGDPLGLLGPPACTAAALDAGETAVTVGAAAQARQEVALVPTATPFGPPGDVGWLVSWRWMPATAGLPDVPTLREAERGLVLALRDAVDALHEAGVTGTSGAIPMLDGRAPAGLDQVLPDRAVDLVARAGWVREVVAAALRDDGDTVTAYAAERRRSTLAPLDAIARRALVAAAAALLEPVAR